MLPRLLERLWENISVKKDDQRKNCPLLASVTTAEKILLKLTKTCFTVNHSLCYHNIKKKESSLLMS